MNCKKEPLISIVTPSYNQGAYIEQTINSVISQNYENKEYIVIDGGSEDQTVEIIKDYRDQIDYWISEKDKGQADAINKGWSKSKGDILAWVNSDDLLARNALEKIAEIYKNEEKKEIIFGNCEEVDRHGKLIRIAKPTNITKESMLRGDTLPQPSVFISSELFKKVGPLNTSLKFELDWEYFIRCFDKINENSTHYIDEILSKSRNYSDTKTRTGFEEKGKERRRCILNGEVGRLIDSKKNLKEYIAETYILQGAYLFRGGKYWKCLISAAKAASYSPAVLFKKIPKFPWLIRRGLVNSGT